VAGEDIKGIWEVSRFDGLVCLALGWLVSGDWRYLDGAERWISDWVRHNPANVGVQWRCGQETSIRLIQTLLVAELLREYGGITSEPALVRFVHEHVQRIMPTMLYAVAQENNHATSEAAALYVAGVWLRLHSEANTCSARALFRLGRKMLEKRVRRLVMPDGSFSQHSVNYHRLALDTLCLVEWWRRRCGDAHFSTTFYARAAAATRWLQAMTDVRCGDAPNLGANDGARIAVLHALPYRDFRASVQTASALFLEQRAYSPGPWDEPLAWFGINARDVSSSRRESHLFPHGGYATLLRGRSWLLLRLPRYEFRPSHADALHVDLWHDGQNVIRDGGSFLYNAEGAWHEYFSGTASHSTVQFDGRDQMPRLGRFLFGTWLRCQELEYSDDRVRAGYTDYRGATHVRTAECTDQGFRIRDQLSGFVKSAVLRWRLAPGQWFLDGVSVRSKAAGVTIRCEGRFRRFELVEGWESRHYGERTAIPVLEIEMAPRAAAEVCTTVELD
jgi:hypothetical protein